MSDTVQSGQSLFDKAIELTGNVDNTFAMSVANDLSVTDDLAIGSNIKTAGATLPAILAVFAGATCAIATAYSPKPDEVALEGIDYWAIESTFIIS